MKFSEIVGHTELKATLARAVDEGRISHAQLLSGDCGSGTLPLALTYAQYLLWPQSTSMAIQVRISEALCVFAFFTPAAIPGLTLGCLLFNLTFAGTLPMDWLVGTLATLIAVEGMWLTRKVTLKGYPCWVCCCPP